MHHEALIRLYRRYVARNRLLLQFYGCPLPQSLVEKEICVPVHRYGRAFLVVRLQHLWGEFSRELVVRSALGHCKTRTGRELPRVPSVLSFADIPKITGKPMAGRGANWDDPSFALRQANTLNVVNYNEILLGLGSADLSDIRCVRNFIVHPNSFTRANYVQLTRNLGLIGLEPDLLLAHKVIGGATMFDSWIEDLLNAAWKAVE